MIQNFEIDTKKKERIQKSFYRHSKLNYLLYAWLLLWVIANVAWFLRCRGSSALIEIDPALQWCIFAFINIAFPILYIVLRIVRRRVNGKYTTERQNESLLIRDGLIEYGYQNPDHTSRDRVIVLIKDYTVNVKDDRIRFNGQVCQRYYSNYAAGITEAPDKFIEGNWVLYDYFEPSLKEWIYSNNVASHE